MSMPWFPMFVDLSGRRALVVGGGRIAARRAGALLRFCGAVTVVAPDIAPELEGTGAELIRRRYAPGDLEGAALVVAATDDSALNACIARDCRARGVPVNVASDHTLCDFYFPGVAVRGNVAVGVTAGGADHRLARRVTEAVRQAVDAMDIPEPER